MEKYVLKIDENGQEITVRDVQLVLLEMLEVVDGICRKYNIPYFLNGGSALGAVRHGGFIPWDDDVDIAMMRSDYLRFIQALKQDLQEPYCFQCFEIDVRYNVLIPGMKIRKKGTYVKETNSLLENRCKECDGLFIDVFVYDYVSVNKLIDLPFRVLNQAIMPFLIAGDNVGMNPLFLKRWFSSNAHVYGKINEGSQYIGFDIKWTFKSPFKPFIFRYDDIYPVQYVKFEDKQFPIARHPHEYLCTAIAPSYMTPPPVDQQKPKHIVDIQL